MIGLWWLAGCRSADERFADDFVEAYCAAVYRCDPDADALLGFVPCADVFGPDQRALTACQRAHCRLDHRAARTCVDGLEAASCAAFDLGQPLDPCAEVFVDCDAGVDRCFE